ncbi:pyridoxal phosphate biosynthetic protein PdxA [Bacteroidales bacterium KA00344]|nr:pyridoxal phosphate biosynthetic protein PdxA [Bacteroidales bacterium KA00344]
MNNKMIRVAITHGDTNGIGYEMIFKTFADPAMLEICTPIIYGSPKVATYHRNALEIEANFSIINAATEAEDGRINMLPVFDEEIKVEFGTPSEEANHAAVKALDKALIDYKEGLFDVLVTTPANDNNLEINGYPIPCTSRYIETSVGNGHKGIDILMNEWMRMAMMTDNIALKDVAKNITPEGIIEKVASFFTTLRRDMRISNPRIAILALNPNDSEDHPGKEETDAIIPAVQKLADVGVSVFGPYQVDDFFGTGEYEAFDGVLAMYHDQGVAPFKALSPENNVHYFGGLPLISTTPDVGPGYDIAGQGVADEVPLRYAIYQAIDGFRNRNNYDEPLAHPLPKLYHERKDDSEKVRFSIPKKHDKANKERQKKD